MHNTSSLPWLDTALGQYLLMEEKAIYDAHVANVFGFNALQMGMLAHDLLEQSRIPQKIHADIDAGNVWLEPAFLPFSEASIDLICMPHTLEFSQNPHQTLREVERVLLPEGYVILTGFNPYSLWGVRRALSKRKLYPWCGTHLTMSRVQDWLALLGLETVKSGTLGFALPVNDSRWLGKQRFLESMGHRCMPFFGGIYYVMAQKRVVNMTLLKPNWKKSLVPAGLMTKPRQSKPVKQTTIDRNKN